MAKTVFLASDWFTGYDVGAQYFDLCAVRVTNQCYNALKARDLKLDREELMHYCDVRQYVPTRSKTYGGEEGFTFKELQKFVGIGGMLTATQVRAL